MAPVDHGNMIDCESPLFPRFLVQVHYRPKEPVVKTKPARGNLATTVIRNLLGHVVQKVGMRIKTMIFPLLFVPVVFLLLLTSRTPLPQVQVPSESLPEFSHQPHRPRDSNRSLSSRSSIIFVGGFPRSGTTLMRGMLDAHPDIRCGPETHVIPSILALVDTYSKMPVLKKRLDEAGVSTPVLDTAMRSFILDVIEGHGSPASRLCNKDPFTLLWTSYLHRLFPNALFLLLLRDGRAVAHSVVSRKVTINGYNTSSYHDSLVRWNRAVESMYSQCLRLGQYRCMPVYYEQLVLHPKVWLERILDFLQVPWNDSVLHHQDFVGKPGGISLSREEKSWDQVMKPVNTEALSRWADHIPDDVRRRAGELAPLLNVLGYDPSANPPDYSNPLPDVADNSIHFTKNARLWERTWLETQE